MKCPQCLFEQAPSDTCIACGFSFKPKAAAPAPTPDKGAGQLSQDGFFRPASTPPSSAAKSSPYDRPIRPALRAVRSVGGLLGAAFGAWLFVFGQDIVMAPWEVLLFIVYLCISLFWLLTAPIRVSIRQFSIELLLFIGAALLLRILIPDAFDVDRLVKDREGTRLLVAGPVDAGDRSSEAAGFSPDCAVLCGGAEAILADPADLEKLDQWKQHCDRLQAGFTNLSTADQARWGGAYKRITMLRNRLERAVETGAAEDIEEARRILEALRDAVNQVSTD